MQEGELKILYTEIDEEVASVIDRLKAEKASEIEIVIPRRALILQSLVSLKLLAKQAKKLEKEISIVTVDKKGRDLATSIGIKTTTKASVSGASNSNEKKQVAEPRKESVRSHGSQSIQDVLSATKTQKSQHYEGKVTIESGNSRKQTASYSAKKAQKVGFTSGNHISGSLETGTLNRKLLVFFTTLSLVMLAVVFMVILPSTTITLNPKSDVIAYPANLKIIDAEKGAELIDDNPNRYIPSYTVTATSQVKETFSTTGVSQNGANASGTITVKNDGTHTQALIRRTRFRSSDGVIYRLKEAVSIPRGGEVQAEIVADALDEKGEVTGARGNLTEGRLTIPGLREANQKVIYGVVSQPLVGGVSEATQIVSEGDIEAAKQKLIDRIKEKLIVQLQDEAKALGKKLDRDLKILDTASAIKQGEIETRLANNLQPNQPAEDFTLSVSLTLEAQAYDYNEFKRIMDRGVLGRVTPDTKVIRVNYDEVQFSILDEDPQAGEYTIDANIEALIKYDIDGYYKNIIISNIAGKSLDEAIKYLQSQPFLAGKAKIRMWPFWLTKIPSLADNIRIKEIE